jgi:hypothetical protein
METKRIATLKAAGFRETPSYNLWIARDHRKAFSGEAISDYDSKWFASSLAESVPENEFWFYLSFQSAGSLQGCQEILSKLHLDHLTPVIRTQK